MPIEYCCLSAFTIFFLFAWFPVSVGKWQAFGGPWLLSNREPVSGKGLPAWAARCERAHNNLKDYFPAFIVAILVLGMMEKFDKSTSYAALLFVAGRIGHYVSYGIGHVPARAASFFIALLCNLYLLIKIFI